MTHAVDAQNRRISAGTIRQLGAENRLVLTGRGRRPAVCVPMKKGQEMMTMTKVAEDLTSRLNQLFNRLSETRPQFRSYGEALEQVVAAPAWDSSGDNGLEDLAEKLSRMFREGSGESQPNGRVIAHIAESIEDEDVEMFVDWPVGIADQSQLPIAKLAIARLAADSIYGE